MTSRASFQTTSSGAEVPAPIAALGRRLVGRLITPAMPEYEKARRIHDPSVDRRPVAVVQAGDSIDVAETVRLAAREGYTLAVRGGGHSLAAHSTGDGVLVLDLSGMRGIAIDPLSGTARVQAGATSGDLAGPAHTHGLALSTGDTSTVGLGGLTTGGGIGFFARRHGLAIDNLLSVRIVTADGELITASEQEHADLFWAIRGGGGNFGVVTEFEFRLARVGEIYGGVLALPATPAVVRGYLNYVADAPDDLTTIANLMHAPPAPFIPDEQLGAPVLMILVCWTGDVEEGERVVAPLRALAPAVADVVGPMPYPAMYDFTQAAAEPHGAAIRQMFADEIDDEAIDAMLAALDRATSPVSMIQFRGLGGAIARVPTGRTAYAHRDARYLVAVLGLWFDPAEDATPHRRWVETHWDEIRRLGRGAYVNFLGNEGGERVGEAYDPATLARLAEVKRTYDPANLFRMNQNISPGQ